MKSQDDDSPSDVSSVTDPSRFPGDDAIDLEEDACAEDDAIVCKNGGVCLSTITGPRCHCPLQFRGRQCEEEVHVDVPGFVGHSLLVHRLQQDGGTLDQGDGFKMVLSFQTSSPDGVIFYSEGN